MKKKRYKNIYIYIFAKRYKNRYEKVLLLALNKDLSFGMICE